MKIISIHRNQKVENLITELRNQNRLAQKELFEKYSSKMLAVCRSYVSDFHHAEDCMLKAFVKVFKNIDSFKSQGSFEGWIRKIMVNECLDFIKLNKSMVYVDEFETEIETENFDENLDEIDAFKILDQLPENYRTVFNLFVLEEYSHKEIAEILSISEANSKSQLFRAKRKLKELILQQKKRTHEI